MIIADTNEFHPLVNAAAYRDAREPDGSNHPVIILRATYSTGQVDLAYRASVRAARAAGLRIGHYGYMTAGADAAAQGRFFAQTVNANGGLRPGDTIWCDDEEGTGNQAPRAQAWLTAAHGVLRDRLLDEGVYSGAAFWKAHLGSLPSGPHRWIAAYGQPDPQLPGEDLWQFTSNRVMTGVSGPCDASVFNGTLNRYLAMVGALPPRPAETPHVEDYPMLLNKGAGAVTPVALPNDVKRHRFATNTQAKVRVDFLGVKDASENLTVGYSNSPDGCANPAGCKSVIIHRVDGGSNDVSYVPVL